MSLENKTVAELRMVAKERGVELPRGLNKRQIVVALQGNINNIITVNTVKPSGDPSILSDENGVIISPGADKKKAVLASKPEPEKIAIYAERNLSWQGIGKVDKGYNFVPKEVAEKWITHRLVRKATPDEVAAHYGV